MEHIETVVTHGILWLKLAIEATGAIVIAVGCLAAALKLTGLRTRQAGEFTATRLELAKYLALGLEFQLAADILVTAVSPSWEEIGKLAAIATIRTALNLALAREMKDERNELRDVQDKPEAALA